MAAISRKVAQELERTIREVNTAIQDYDDNWHKLKSFNTKHSEVIGVYGGDGIRGSQLITQRAGRKAQTIITNTNGVVEGIDIKHIGDSRVRIENLLSASLRRLHRLREELVEILGHHDLRSQEQQVLTIKKQIEMRYRRGKSFYLCGNTSEFCIDDEVDGSDDPPLQHEQWIDDSIETMKDQIEKFNAVIEELTAQICKASSGSDGISIELLVDRIAQHEALVDTHNLHIEKLESVLRALRNGTVESYGGDIGALREALDPYINENDDLTIVVHDEIYTDFDPSLFNKTNNATSPTKKDSLPTVLSTDNVQRLRDTQRPTISAQPSPMISQSKVTGANVETTPKTLRTVRSTSIPETTPKQSNDQLILNESKNASEQSKPDSNTTSLKTPTKIPSQNSPISPGTASSPKIVPSPTIQPSSSPSNRSNDLPVVPSQPTILPDPAKKRKQLLLRQQQLQQAQSLSQEPSNHTTMQRPMTQSPHHTPQRSRQIASVSQNRPVSIVSNIQEPSSNRSLYPFPSSHEKNSPSFQLTPQRTQIKYQTDLIPTIPHSSTINAMIANHTENNIGASKSSKQNPISTVNHAPWTNSDLAICHCLKLIRMYAISTAQNRFHWWSLYIFEALRKSHSNEVINILHEMANIVGNTSTIESESSNILVSTPDVFMFPHMPTRTLPFQLDVIYSPCTAKTKQDNTPIKLRKGDIFVKISKSKPPGTSVGLIVPSAHQDGQTLESTYTPNIEAIVSCCVSDRSLSSSVLECLSGSEQETPEVVDSVDPLKAEYLTDSSRRHEICKAMSSNQWSSELLHFISNLPLVIIDWDYEGFDIYHRPVIISPKCRAKCLARKGSEVLLRLENQSYRGQNVFIWVPDYLVMHSGGVIGEFSTRLRHRIAQHDPHVILEPVHMNTKELWYNGNSSVTRRIDDYSKMMAPLRKYHFHA